MKQLSRLRSADAMQNIVMDDEASARQAIQYLKRQQAGRATLLPLDVIRARQIPDAGFAPSSKNDEGYIGIAAHLIYLCGALPQYRPQSAWQCNHR